MGAEKVIKSERRMESTTHSRRIQSDTEERDRTRFYGASTTIVKSRAPITVFAVEARSLIRRPSTTLEPGGPVSGNAVSRRIDCDEIGP